MYDIRKVSGQDCAEEITKFNALFHDQFTALKPRHLDRGHWWLVYLAGRTVGFAGMVPFHPFSRVGYLKRAAILPEHRGHGLQRQLIDVREEFARSGTDWTHLISECLASNVSSANNFIRAGFMLCEPERPWEKDTLYWIKEIQRSDAVDSGKRGA